MFSPFRIVFGTLYPAYSSYKAVKSRDLKEYVSALLYLADENDTVWRWVWLRLSPTLQVKWMMYWIIFALFSTVEVFTDMFLCWWVQLFLHFTAFISAPRTRALLLGRNFRLIFSLQASFLLWAEDSLYCVAALPLHERLQCALQEVCSSYTFLKRKGEILSSVRPPVNPRGNSIQTFAPLFVRWCCLMQLEPPGERNRLESCSLFDPRRF